MRLIFLIISIFIFSVSGLSAGENNFAIALHGGAGAISKKNMTPEMEKAYRDILEKALRAGYEVLEKGGASLDAVEKAINIMEDSPLFNAGRGAVVTTEGKAELDASIMDGKTLACGAVAGVTKVKNPISTARLVMTQTKHVLLAGGGADAFAESERVELVEPNYFLSNRAKATSDGGEDQPHYGTVGCVAIDVDGNLAAGTSTGGTTKKLPGRVGDSPIIGAGTYADNQTCAVSGTGIGEEYIRNAVAYDISAQMKYAARSLQESVDHVMTDRLKTNDGGVISVSNRAVIVMRHNTPGMSCGAADSTGRFETFLTLDH